MHGILHKRIRPGVFLLGLLACLCGNSGATDLPLPSLRDSADPKLQRDLERSLNRLGLGDAMRQKSLGLALVDLSDPDNVRMAAINGDRMMYAASLPKIAILMGAFERIEHGDMDMDARTTDRLTRMIRNSSNHAATQVLEEVGMPYLAQLLQSPRYRLYDAKKNGGLWVGKPYGKAGAWKRDPLHRLSHGATPVQVARFYYMLQNGRLVSPSASRKMKEILGQPAIHHKFVKGLERHRPDSAIFRKSGSWRNWHADSAIVERDGYQYIAVALAHHPAGGQWLSELIVAMDDLVVRAHPTRLVSTSPVH